MRRIAITQRVDVVADRNERRDALDQAWTTVLATRGWLPIPLPNAVPDPVAALRELAVDAVLLSGGNDLATLPGAAAPAPERDALEHALLDACADAGVPVLGVCRGMQLLATHWGATLAPVDGHVGTPHALVAASGALAAFGPRGTVNSFHAWGLVDDGLRGAEIEPVAYAPDGTIEAVMHRRHRQWGIMWHPERAPCDPRDLVLLEALVAPSVAA